MFYVYVITNKITDKVYIGQSVNVQERLSKHFSQLRNGYHSNTYLQRSYNTYGRQCFEYYTLGEYVTKEEVNIAETFYISWFKLLDLCYNLTAGGESPIMDEEIKQKISNSKMGHTVTEETRQKLSDSHKGQVAWNKGKALSEEHKAALRKPKNIEKKIYNRINCNKEHFPTRKGGCSTCAEYYRRTGRDKSKEITT